MEELDGTPLSQKLLTKLSIHEFLTLALQITRRLAQIHQQHIVYRDVNPSNIVLNTQTDQVEFIGFGSANTLLQEPSTVHSSHALKNALAKDSVRRVGSVVVLHGVAG